MSREDSLRGTLWQAYCENLYRAEVKAKRDKVGMWAQGAKYESPAAFRRRMRLAGEWLPAPARWKRGQNSKYPRQSRGLYVCWPLKGA